jgi:hypothetical protein
MKIKSTSNIERRTPNIEWPRIAPANFFGVRCSMFDVRCSLSSQKGVALIITLILLAVVTFMALTFLAVSRRERGAVTTATDTATAQLAADDALAGAEAQVVANVLATTNPYNFGLLVSTNYLPPVAAPYPDYLTNLWIDPRTPVWLSNTVTRVMENRFYLDLNRNGTNDPNGYLPVMGPNGGFIHPDGTENNNPANVVTNFQVGDPEWIGVLQHPDQPYGPNNPFVARYAFVAVPIGNALDLNAIYNQVRDEGQAAQNGRIRVNPSPFGPGIDSFLRNQGVGSWEINLAAFLADLNTNQWLPTVLPDVRYYWYQYQPYPNYENQGAAFNDARALLAYRYQNNYLSLKRANLLFANQPPYFPVSSIVPFDNIDEYSDGPLQTTPAPINEAGNRGNRDDPTLSWAGADNTNHFFDLQELFNPSESSISFTNHLTLADDGPSTYNRYTYYRLLSQMGVESAPEQNQINLNYSNAFAYFNNYGVVTSIAFYPGAETNLTPWTPLQFFTIAADKLLRDYSQEWQVESPSNFVATFNVTNAFGLTNIPVLVSNQFVYTPAVQRVLQLAANIYDATTNNATAIAPDYPSVFRPIFLITNDLVSGYTNVYINGYEPVILRTSPPPLNSPQDPQLNLPVNVTDLLNPNTPFGFGPGIYTNVNVYGVPWIVGAKKGYPNFNEFAMESVFQLTRKLQVTRPSTNSPISDYQYNQMFNLSLSNQFGVECWNSYTNNFLRSVAIYVTCANSYLLTNDEGFIGGIGFLTTGFLPLDGTSNNNNGWPGYNPTVNPLMAPLSFQIPLDTNFSVIPTSMYRFNVGAPPPTLTTNLALDFEQNVTGYPQPHWWLMTTNDVRVIILDTTVVPNQVIDYVQLRGPNSIRDLSSEIISQYDTTTVPSEPSGDNLWNTNLLNGVPIGLLSQIGVSLWSFPAGLGSDAWNNTDTTTRDNEIDGFRAFFGYGPLYNNVGAQQAIAEAAMTNFIQAPYTPTATVVQHFSWQANDPLVHYTASDLNWAGANQLNRTVDDLTNEDLGALNQRYMPWGGNPILGGADKNPYNLALKDPLVWQSDDWDFPTYKMPTVGWLGRVHRGTPWQTVYLKSPDILEQTNTSGVVIGTNTWVQLTGDALLPTNSGQYYDAANTAPAQDRLLFDNFTTAFNDNATRGQLAVNVGASDPNNPQAGLAAWSALFSGVEVFSNNAPDSAVNPVVPTIVQHNGSLTNYTPFPINPAGPAGANAVLGQIVQGINQTRANYVNVDGLKGTFEHVGDILGVPQLSDQSPFLNWFDNGQPAQQINGISDEMYEWLPQQAMSLLRVSGTPQSPTRYVIYCYGQALKPAANGINTGGGPLFGMVTNYQVVAESATRAVVRFNGTRVDNIFQINNGFGSMIWTNAPSITNNNVVIERFNVLPPN